MKLPPILGRGSPNKAGLGGSTKWVESLKEAERDDSENNDSGATNAKPSGDTGLINFESKDGYNMQKEGGE